MRIFLALILLFLASGCVSEVPTEQAYNPERKYPSTIKGMVEPGANQVETLLRNDAQTIKDLGVNTVTIYPYYSYEGGELVMKTFGQAPLEVYANAIRLAKAEGLAVFLSNNLVGPEGQMVGVSLEKYLEDSKRIAIETAAMAEQEKVEYFAPQGEIDVQVMINYYGSQWGNETAIKEISGIINRWHADVLPEIRKVYSGRIVYQTGMSLFHFRNATGYDYLAIDFNQNSFTLDEFRNHSKQVYQETETAAAASGSGWFVSEAWFPYTVFGTTNSAGESFDELQDDYYRVSLEEFIAFGSTRKHGYMFNSYREPGQDIRSRPAEAVIAEFYEKI